MTTLSIARTELILGGQRSGKSRRAELLARDWLAQSPDHAGVFVATAQAWDVEMCERIARHQADRAERLPGMLTVEEPLALADVLERHSKPRTIVVIDCLTLWLTNLLMPPQSDENTVNIDENKEIDAAVRSARSSLAMLLLAFKNAPGPVVLVGNEIGLGVIPLGREIRTFVDELGRLNQEVAASCARVTLMVAGLPLTLKGQP